MIIFIFKILILTNFLQFNQNDKIVNTCFGKYEPVLLSTKQVSDSIIPTNIVVENPILWNGSNKSKNKYVNIGYICFKNSFIKINTFIDSINFDLKINETKSNDKSGNEFWQEKVKIDIYDSNQLIVKSNQSMRIEIFEEYIYVSPIFKTNINSSIENKINVKLESNKYYIAVFYNLDNQIVNIQRLKV